MSYIFKKSIKKIYNFRSLLKHRYRYKRKVNQCAAHPEWEKLTREELSLIPKRERPYYTIFKNTAGLDKDNLKYYITDRIYEDEILPRLNPLTHPIKGGGTDAFALFAEKNYYPYLF